MGLSRWGKRVNEAMSRKPQQQPAQKTVSQIISEKADEILVDQTSAYIAEGIAMRMARFYGQRVAISAHYNRMVDGYTVEIHFDGRSENILISNQRIVDASQDAKSWNGLLDNETRRAGLIVRKLNGGSPVVSTNQGADVPWRTVEDWHAVTRSYEGLDQVDRNAQRHEAEEEAAAIESIKRSLSPDQ